ncbi:hypothetical protein [Microbacterium rhizophilus]|uniref:hypothetical protein n=1 Tax=Microbacterium rhizophilus TaxID=3138934 RepID=UPI0031ED6B6F
MANLRIPPALVLVAIVFLAGCSDAAARHTAPTERPPAGHATPTGDAEPTIPPDAVVVASETDAARDAYAAWIGAQDDFLTAQYTATSLRTLADRSSDEVYTALQWRLSGFTADGIVQRGRHEIPRFRTLDPKDVEVPADYAMAITPATADVAARACLDASAVEYVDLEGAVLGRPTALQEIDLLFTADGPGGALVVAYAGSAGGEACG